MLRRARTRIHPGRSKAMLVGAAAVLLVGVVGAVTFTDLRSGAVPASGVKSAGLGPAESSGGLQRSSPLPGSAGSAPVRPLGPGGDWVLTFDDEFAGTTLDRTKWNTNWLGAPGAVTPPVNDYELANYAPSHVTVGGGYLRLTATADPSVTSAGSQRRPYTSGLVDTDGLYQYRYGFAEARIYIPGSRGTVYNWPAFWADGTGRWPTTGEDDVMEGGKGRIGFHFISSKGRTDTPVAGNFTGWHTFGADWEPNSVTYYYDGRRVGRAVRGITGAPMYLIVGLAVGGTYSGPVSLPSTLLVDYVRVWQHS